MDKTLLDSFSFIAVIVASASVIATLYSLISEKMEQNRKLIKLENEVFEIALESSNIVTLGKYLDNEIGQLSISDYVSNKEINKRIDILIDRLTQYVGTEEEIIREANQEDKFKGTNVTIDVSKAFPPTGKLGIEYDKIIKELYSGEPWNALARLRRFIEITLKEIANKNDILVERSISITKLIDLLNLHGIIPLDRARNLKYTILVSNRAIHGGELKQGEAEQALYYATIALDQIISH